MKPSPTELALPHIRALDAYTPGQQPQETGWVKLNTNENPYPPSPRVVEAILREVGSDGGRLRLYPQPDSRLLREAIARAHRVGADCVCLGNGSDDILNLLMRVFCGQGAAAAMLVPSYSLYPVIAGVQGGRLVEVPFDEEMLLPVEAMARSGANILFLTSPNAPTGVGFRKEALRGVLESFAGMLVVDEAYAAFAAEDAVSLLATYPRLVITRTFSKSHGLAGMRVGYALGHPETIALLHKVRDSYNLDRLAQAAACAAIEDEAYYGEVLRRVKATREAFAVGVARRGWFAYPSQSNFVFLRPQDAAGQTGLAVALSLDAHLRSRKILVRHFAKHPLTCAFLRVSIGTDAEMQTLSEAFDTWPTHA